MKTVLIHPAYFPNVETMAHIVTADKVIWETHDNFQKQTFRNRTYIAHTNGQLLLNIPVKHRHGHRQKTAETRPENDFSWQKQHLKSIQTAYRSSPFFEYYEDDIEPLFAKAPEFLMAHNLQIINTLLDLMDVEVEMAPSETYEKSPEVLDLRHLVDAKRPSSFQAGHYVQVLEENHGFLPNLSILDALFNLGPETVAYLKRQNV